jgi:N-terminal domain of (some) glycogen debranching enzymes
VIGIALTILEGSTSCISDEIGDIGGETSGFFSQGTRFLSAFRLRLDGGRPLLLSSGRFSTSRPPRIFATRWPAASRRMPSPLSGSGFVGRAIQETITLQNLRMEALELEPAIEVEADFADILSIEQRDFSLGDRRYAPRLPERTRDRRPVQLQRRRTTPTTVATSVAGWLRTPTVSSCARCGRQAQT